MAVPEHIAAAITAAMTFDDLAAVVASTFYFSVDNWKDRVARAEKALTLVRHAKAAVNPIDRAEWGAHIFLNVRHYRDDMEMIGADYDAFLADIDALKPDRPVGQIARETYLAAGALPEAVHSQNAALAEIVGKIYKLAKIIEASSKLLAATKGREIDEYKERAGLFAAEDALRKAHDEYIAGMTDLNLKIARGELPRDAYGEEQARIAAEYNQVVSPIKKKISAITNEVLLMRRAANSEHWERTKDIEAELGKLHVERTSAEGDLRRRVLDHALETSEITQEAADDWAGSQTITDGAKRRLRKIGYTEEQVRKDMAEFYRLTGGRANRVTIETKGKRRASAAIVEATISMDGTFNKVTLWHEMGHLLERHQRIKAMANDFLDIRTGRKSSGATPKTLRRIKKNKLFKSDEIAYEDKFFDAYVGKVYRDGYTEILSMGMQQFAHPSGCVELMDRDPEMFQLMVGVMRTPMGELERTAIESDNAVTAEKRTVEEAGKAFYKELEKKSRDIEARIQGSEYVITSGWRKNQHVAMLKTGPGEQTVLGYFKSGRTARMFMYLYIMAEQMGGREWARNMSYHIDRSIKENHIPSPLITDKTKWKIPDISIPMINT
ncbi:MAG: hypothetical protein ABIL58_23235 [Pseudomonadota bacterium]